MTLSDQEVLDKIHKINLDMLLAVDEICRRHDITYFLGCGGLLGALRHHDFIPWDNDVDLDMTREEFDRLLPYLMEELDPELYEVVMPEDYGKKYFDMVPRINYKKAEIRMDPGYVEYYEHMANRIVIDFYFLDKVPKGLKGSLFIRRLEFLYGLLNGKRYDLDLRNYHGIMKAAAVVLRFFGRFFSADVLRRHINKIAVKYNKDPEIDTLRVTNDTIHAFTFEFPESCFARTREVPIGKYLFKGPVEAEKVMEIHFGDYMTLPPEEERIPHWGFIPITAENFIFDD